MYASTQHRTSLPGRQSRDGRCDANLQGGPSRRSLLHTALAAATAFCATAGAASAQTQMSQAAAGYQDQPNGDKRCAGCSHFEPPNKCQLVTGAINPQGWCRLYAPKSGG